LEAADYGSWTKNKIDNFGNKVPMPTPPPELKIAIQCKGWDALPYAGGILDQPYGLLDRLGSIYNIYIAHKKYANLKSDEVSDFIANEPELYAIIQEVQEMKENKNV